MEAPDRDAVVRALAAKVQQLQTQSDPLTRAQLAHDVLALRAELGAAPHAPALMTLTGQEVSASTDPHQVFEDARYWFKTRLQGREFASQIGRILVNGASWKEIKRGGKQDTLKLRLLPAIPALLQTGKYHGRADPNKERTDGKVAFHFFSAVIGLPGLVVEAGVQVSEDANGQLVYSLTHDLSVPWQKKNAFIGIAGERAPPDEGAGATGEAALDGILPAPPDSVNLLILRVLRR